jgi:hypothetical protein
MRVSTIGAEILSTLKVLSATALIIIAAAANACRAHPTSSTVDSAAETAGEPEEYSARVIRTIEAGDHHEVEETRVAVAGGMMRQEWREQGQPRVLIWRPDLGKSFLLAPDQGSYVESAIYPDAAEFQQPAAAAGDSSKPSGGSEEAALRNRYAVDPEGIERDVGATSVESEALTKGLPDQSIDGHPCTVLLKQATFPDGTTEVTRMFRATDLAGLAIRIENESTSASGKVKITTERKDIQKKISPDEFEVPAGFKKVAHLAGGTL